MKKIFKKLAGLMMSLLVIGGLAGIGASSNEAPVVAEAAIVKGTKLYLTPGLWNVDGARFAAYFCNGSSPASWYSMLDVNGDGIYEAESNGNHKNVIFVRMDGSKTDNNWNNKWNQTGDLTYDGIKNHFKVTGWGSGSWTTYNEPIVNYHVDGKSVKTAASLTFNPIEYYSDDKTKIVTQWYKKADYTNKISSGAKLTTNIDVYGKSVYTWSIIGTFTEKEWDEDNISSLTYNATSKAFEISIELKKDDLFKIRYAENWEKKTIIDSWRDDDKICENLDKKIIDDDGTTDHNIKVIKSGYYLISIKDDNVQNYGDESYGWSITEITKTITYHLTNGTTESETASYFNSKFYREEGKRLVGWYTDSELTNEFKKGSFVKENIDLYPKYIEAKEHTIYVYDPTDELGGIAYAYIWRDLTDGGENAPWPGVRMSKVEGIDNYYCLNINDPSASYDRIIINNGKDKSQTDGVDMTYCSTTVYTIGASATTTLPLEVNEIVAAIAGVAGVDTTGYYVENSVGEVSEAVYIQLNQKQAAFEKYMADVDTCATYKNVKEYRSLSEGLDTTVTITEKNGNKVTIEDKLTYMETKKALEDPKNNPSPLGNNLLSNISSNNNIAIILIIGLLGLATIGGYYYLNKKKYAK